MWVPQDVSLTNKLPWKKYVPVQNQGLHLEWIENYNTPLVMGTRRVSGTDIVSGMDLRISLGSTPNFQLFQFHSFRFSLKQINQSIARNFKSKFRIWRNSVEWTQHYSGWTAQRGTLSAWQTDSRLTPSSMPVPSPCRTLERFPRRGTSMFTSAHWSPSPTLYVRLLLHPRQYSHQMGLFIKISLRLLILRSAMHKMKNSRICEESQKAFDHGYSKWAWNQACGWNGPLDGLFQRGTVILLGLVDLFSTFWSQGLPLS